MTNTHTPPPHLLDAIIDGSVTTLVQRCEPQPSRWVTWEDKEMNPELRDFFGNEIRSPFPAPGEPLTILDSNGDAVAEVVVVERGCKQVKEMSIVEAGSLRDDIGTNWWEVIDNDWYFTATVRKDGSYE
tara:strand:- start:396578 stop:396964 length:387 start_codon:yes stop_codon:yes gene_type:complete